MDARFICWIDEFGMRGMIPQSTPHTLRQIAGELYFEAPNIAVTLANDADIFIVTKEEQAFAWVKTGTAKGKLAETCTEKGV